MNILKSKYNTQVAGAKARGIEWQFTFESWLEWWGKDIDQRGNKSGQLVMARIGDTGSYHPDNVRKITCNENHSEAHTNGVVGIKGKPLSEEHRAKISASVKGIKKPGRTNAPWSEERRAKVAAAWAAKQAFNPVN